MSEASPWESTMRIGILGSGLMGGKLGTIFARAGHEVVFSYAHSEQKLKRLAREAGGNARAGTPREAAQDAEAVLLAVHWLRFDDVLKQAGDLSGKVVVTCSMPMNEDNTELVVAHTSSGAEELAKRIPKARVVAAFGTVPSEVFFDVYEARRKAKRPSLLYCGDDRRGKRHAGDRSLRHALAFVGSPARSLATRRAHCGSLGCRGPRRRGLHLHRDSTHAQADHVPTGVRGLVIPRPAAVGRVRNPRALGVRVSLSYQR